MVDFQITFQSDALLYGDFKKVRLISKAMLEHFYENSNPKESCLLDKLKTLLVAKEMCLLFLSVGFYFIGIGLIYRKLCSFKH